MHVNLKALQFVAVLCALLSVATAAPSIELLTKGRIDVGQPLTFFWDFGHPGSYDDNIVVFPYNTTDVCLGSAMIACIDRYSPSTYPAAEEISWQANNGTTTVERSTTFIGKWVAWLVSGTEATLTGIVSVTFLVNSTNTVEVLFPTPSTAPIQLGMVLQWTAPEMHSDNDGLVLFKSGCVPDEYDNCAFKSEPVPRGASGIIHFGFSETDVGTAFEVKYIVDFFTDRYHEYNQVSVSFPEMTVASIPGKCDPLCSNAGTSCAMENGGTECTDCTGSESCILPDPIVFTTPDGSGTIDLIKLSGDKSFNARFLVSGSLQETIFAVSAMSGTKKFTHDSVNTSLVDMQWTTSEFLDSGWYDYEFFAVDPLGRDSGRAYLNLDLRDNYCSISGDPHFVTFDDLAYDFQGVGEYTVFKPAGNLSELTEYQRAFSVQARFEGCFGGTKVTCVSAAAISLPYGSTISIVSEFNQVTGETTWTLVVDNQIVTVAIGGKMNITVTNPNNGYTINIGTLTSESGYFAFDLLRSIGAKVKVDWDGLAIYVSVNSAWIGRSFGLCGTFDNDIDNDYTLPNGLVAFNASSPTVTASDVYYDFGMEWHIREEESLFNYALFNTTYFRVNVNNTKPAFEPTFESPAAEAEANLMCTSIPTATPAEINACLFDVAFGGTGMAFEAMAGVMTRCAMETADACVSPEECGNNWCELHGTCTALPDGTHECVCAAGYSKTNYCAATPNSNAHASSPQTRASSAHTQVTVTSVVIQFNPEDMNGVTTDEIAKEVAATIGVPIQLVTVTFENNGAVVVTISGSNSPAKADELVQAIRKGDAQGTILRKATDAYVMTGSRFLDPASTAPRSVVASVFAAVVLAVVIA